MWAPQFERDMDIQKREKGYKDDEEAGGSLL